MRYFPVLGKCWYADTWGAPRSAGRRHEGVDIIAPEGAPLVAVTAGVISKIVPASSGSRGGNYFRLSTPDGTYFTYIHLQRFAPGLYVGQPVSAGEIVGFVGRTGNAAGPHLHFEVHPQGGNAINPTPIVSEAGGCPTDAPASEPAPAVRDAPPASPWSAVFDPPVDVRRDGMRRRAGIPFSIRVAGFPGVPYDIGAAEVTITLAARSDGRAAVWPCGQGLGLDRGTPLEPTVGGTETSTRVVVHPGARGRICLIAESSVTPSVVLHAFG